VTREVVLGLIFGFLVNEMCDISPWLAKRLVRWSAHHQYLDRARAEIRAEELEALIESRPGKLFKLITAIPFAFQSGMSNASANSTPSSR
jgi:hypothetical protein